MFGLVLSIAIVVDDAIVVVEDCQRIIDQGKMTARQAATKAMKELQGAIVGEVLVLLSVFIPTAFVSGITGELYKQFALTIAASTAFSGFNALTFTPAMCAMFLKPSKKEGKTFFFYRWFSKGYGATLAVYCKIVAHFLKKPWVAIICFFAIVIPAFIIYADLPTSYIPEEDMGGALGPAVVGNISQNTGDNIQKGMFAGCVFPLVLIISVLFVQKLSRLNRA